jgi:hypothetical protein
MATCVHDVMNVLRHIVCLWICVMYDVCYMVGHRWIGVVNLSDTYIIREDV